MDEGALTAMRLRGAILGCGMISEFHLLGWKRIPEAAIVALCDHTVARAEHRNLRHALGARVYADLETMLARERLDFIDILTPPEFHREHCLMAKQAGLHIICQKPLCTTLEDSRVLASEMDGYQKIFAVHENHRYRPWFQAVRQRFTGGFFGNASLLHLQHLSAAEPAEAYKNEAEKGILLEYGTHLVDMMRSILGEPSRVYARLHRLNPRVRGESLAHIVYEYRQTTAVVEVAWKTGVFHQASMLLTGDAGEAWFEGSLTRGDSGRLRISRGGEVVVDEQRNPYDEYVESFYLLEREHVDAMLGLARVVQTAQEHLRTLACTFAAYESAARRQVIDV